ncbi:MAG: NAD(P)-dependent oxidoreductase [Verrucomicrobiia bacterium]
MSFVVEMKIFLTGATGLIGSHVARELLKERHEVHALVRSQSNLWRIEDINPALSGIKPALRLVHGDLLDSSFIPPPSSFDCCIHLAWYVEPGKYLASPANLDFLCASLRLAKNFADRGCRRLVASGSCLEYDASDRPLNESSPTRPRHLYSAVKLALYHALDGFCKTADMQFAWTRFFYQYGPGEDPRRLVPTAINSLLRGQVCNLTPGDQVRDFLHVADVASAVVAVAQSRLTGAVNIGSGVPVTIREIAGTIAALLGRPDLIALGAQPYQPGDPMHIVADNKRLRQNTDWKPQCDLETGLRETIEWWRARL